MVINDDVNARKDMKNSSFLKFLCSIMSKMSKKYEIINIKIENVFQFCVIRMLAINPIAGGAIRMNNVGTNFFGI